jgi:divalent metal cation (Fe/Co/Zn/Cd) transporter
MKGKVSILSANMKTDLYRWAYILALITIFYNVVEGVVSVFLGLQDETLSLFGFGLDSFVEVISGVGVWHMLLRLKQHDYVEPDRFERRALKITGTAFYILTVGLIATAAVNLAQGHQPETTFWGIVIAAISILSMLALVHFKTRVGRDLGSEAIVADAHCTRACLYLSVILLAASAGYEATGIGGMDSAGAMLIAFFAFREGRESFQKAAGKSCSCGASCHQ